MKIFFQQECKLNKNNRLLKLSLELAEHKTSICMIRTLHNSDAIETIEVAIAKQLRH